MPLTTCFRSWDRWEILATSAITIDWICNHGKTIQSPKYMWLQSNDKVNALVIALLFIWCIYTHLYLLAQFTISTMSMCLCTKNCLFVVVNHLDVCVCIYVCVYVCMYVYIRIYRSWTRLITISVRVDSDRREPLKVIPVFVGLLAWGIKSNQIFFLLLLEAKQLRSFK